MKAIIYLAVCLVLISCSKSNEETLGDSNGNTGNCDTVNMKYAADIQPIIKANCYSCHGNGLTQNGVGLDSYNQVKQQVDNKNLIGVITHASGYPAMPKGGPKLSDCDINKIRAWIARGSLNN